MRIIAYVYVIWPHKTRIYSMYLRHINIIISVIMYLRRALVLSSARTEHFTWELQCTCVDCRHHSKLPLLLDVFRVTALAIAIVLVGRCPPLSELTSATPDHANATNGSVAVLSCAPGHHFEALSADTVTVQCRQLTWNLTQSVASCQRKFCLHTTLGYSCNTRVAHIYGSIG